MIAPRPFNFFSQNSAMWRKLVNGNNITGKGRASSYLSNCLGRGHNDSINYEHMSLKDLHPPENWFAEHGSVGNLITPNFW